ncbi:hypothetical protein DITRI_Ditri11bG0070900 [Diplodiscus trichospermus]
MESNPIIFDISSDDDESTSAWQEPEGDDYDWLSDVLEAFDKGFDDPDEVVVVGEVNPNKKSKSGNSSVRKVVGENDDDCVVLEGDPDKPLSNVNDPQEDSEELLIVGQKGEIACRDFAHPRHDCAKFPFSSTSHELHCELCHCFVCDMQAPCRYWGSGISTADHCHATNKVEMWNTLRKSFRLGRNVPVPVVKAPFNSYSAAVPQLNQANQAPHHDNIQLTTQKQVSRLTPTRADGNCIPQTIHVRRPSIIRARPSSARRGIPYNRSVGSRHVPYKSMMQPRPIVSQQLLGVHNTVIQKDQGIQISNVGSQFAPSNTMSRRLDTEVASAMNCNAYIPSEKITSAHPSQNQQNPTSVRISNERNLNPIGWTNLCCSTNLGTYTHQSSTQPTMDSVFANSAPTQSSAYSQPVPQSNICQDTNLLQNQSHATNYGFPDFDFNWVNNISQSNEQSSVDYLQLQSPGSTNEKEPFKEVNEGNNSYYKELESFLLDNQSIPESSLTAELNSLSPDHPPWYAFL